MSRRDTIIIAVLLNAGLLIFLFATSIKSETMESEPSEVSVLASNQEMPVTPPPPQNPASIKSTSIDEVDQTIQNYVTPQVAPAASQGQSNFLADLQAIGTTETSSGTVETSTPEVVEPGYREIKVKKGDFLERIARQHHVTVDDIMKANHLSSTRLKIGQTLKVPAKSSKKEATSTVAASDETKYYTIKNGDNPWTIAVKHHMKVEELLKLNQMNEDEARRLKPGNRIRIK